MTDAREIDREAIRDRLRELWREHLLLDEVGDDLDFFAAGGDSLSAVWLLTEVIDEFCPEADITEMPLDDLTPSVLCDFVLVQRAEAQP